MVLGPTVAIVDQFLNGDDGVHFTVRIDSNGKVWHYRAFASRNALVALGDSGAAPMSDEAIRRIGDGALKFWAAQAETVRFTVNEANVDDGGGFVNNG